MKALAMVFLLAAAPAPVEERPTDPYRAEHAGISDELRHVGAWADALTIVSATEQRKYMGWISAFLDEHIVPHLAFEEAKLFPAVERRAAATSPAMTDAFVAEHRVMEWWMAELAAIRSEKKPDVRRFAERTHDLLGLLDSHFALEGEVLAPFLDRAMTREDYDREIGRGTHGGPT